MNIQHLHHEDIDRERWDAVVTSATTGLPYAMSWYLDIVSPGWEALVTYTSEGDYDIVFPLPVKPLFHVRRLVQPVLTQQLGLFSSRRVSEGEVMSFLQAIPYRSYALQLNEANPIESLKASRRINLTVSLEWTYENLVKFYSENTRRNVKKSSGLTFEPVSIEEFVPFCRRYNTHNIASERTLVSLLEAAESKGMSVLCGVRQPGEGDLLASAFLLKTRRRLVYLLPASSPEGRRKSAMFRLVDEILRENCSSSLTMDFEGSMVGSVARFYQGFGAQERAYYGVSRFHPEWLVRLYHRMKGEMY